MKLAHIVRIYERIDEAPTKEAFFELLLFLSGNARLFLFPLSRGNFSAVHIATTPEARPYGDAEFAFKGAKDHMRWWFRKPAFERGLIELADLTPRFSDLAIRDDGEATTDLRTVENVQELIALLDQVLR